MATAQYIDLQEAYALLGVLCALSWIFFGLRAWVRLWIVKKPAIDDLLIAIAMLMYTAFIAFAVGLVSNGLGTDINSSVDLAGKERYSHATFYWFFAEQFFILTSTVLRVACGLTLLRVITSKDIIYRWIIIVTVSLMAVFSTIFFLVSLLQCQPISYFWTQPLDPNGGKCIANEHLNTTYDTMAAFYIVHSLISALNDWIMGVLPFFIIRKIQMKKLKKITVIGLLGLGVLAGIMAIIRIPLIIHATRHQFWDDAIPMAVTTALEPALGLIAICSATLMPLFKHGLRRLGSSDGPRCDITDTTTGSRQPASGGSHRLTGTGRWGGGGKAGGGTVVETTGGRDGGGGAYNEKGDANSKTAIVVETSWVVEDEVETDSRHKNSEDNVMNTQGPTHKVEIGV